MAAGARCSARGKMREVCSTLLSDQNCKAVRSHVSGERPDDRLQRDALWQPRDASSQAAAVLRGLGAAGRTRAPGGVLHFGPGLSPEGSAPATDGRFDSDGPKAAMPPQGLESNIKAGASPHLLLRSVQQCNIGHHSKRLRIQSLQKTTQHAQQTTAAWLPLLMTRARS